MATEKYSTEKRGPDAQTEIAGLISYAWRLRTRTELSAAAQACEKALHLSPELDEGWHLLGLLHWDQGERESGIGCLKHAVALNPNQPLHGNTLGVMLIEAGHHVAAESYLEKALELAPGFHDARSNLGLALFRGNKQEQARRCFEEVLAHNPDHCEALANLGMVCLAAGEMQQAARAYEKALTLKPGHPRWQGNLGAAYLAMSRFEDAAGCFRGALAAAPDNSIHGVNLGIALRAMGDLPGSIEALEHARKASSDDGAALANLVVAYQQTCQWSKLEPLYRRLDSLLRTSLTEGRRPVEQPLMNIRRCADPGVNLAVAQAWSRDVERRVLKAAGRIHHRRPSRPRDRIIIGYLSYDFRNHPVSHQLVPLFGLHDRRRFQVKTFSMGPDDGSTFRRDIRRNSDVFIDISEDGHFRAACKIAAQQVDILVDLMGHTHHNRMEILALRPAPLQVGYLGFLASCGAEFINYIIADRVVVPEEHNNFYSEKLIRLPHCYQMNHRTFIDDRLDERPRSPCLPEKEFVYCCFNQTYKIEAEVFASWMRILRRIPNAVLWLCCEQHSAADRLRQTAGNFGIDPRRLVFVERLPLEQHLHRLKSADLALDTITYNGGATTANCLSAGVPVLTVLGTHWVSRMSASHLVAVDLPELVTRDIASYEEKAVHLGRHPDALRSLRRRLGQAHAASPLFRPDIFVKDMEAAFEAVWQRHLDGRPPEHVWIETRGRSAAGSPAGAGPYSSGGRRVHP